MAVNPIYSGSPHVRPVGRTCGEPGEIKKNTHPKNITALFREQGRRTTSRARISSTQGKGRRKWKTLRRRPSQFFFWFGFCFCSALARPWAGNNVVHRLCARTCVRACPCRHAPREVGWGGVGSREARYNIKRGCSHAGHAGVFGGFLTLHAVRLAPCRAVPCQYRCCLPCNG